MQPHRDLREFGTLFSTATAFASPCHEAPTFKRPHAAVAAPRLRPQARAVVRRVLDALLNWHERARQRRSLAELDDHMLRDLGLSRADVSMEIDKPFWRL